MIASLASLPPSEIRHLICELTDRQAEQLLYDWSFWARPEQLEPPGDWLTWAIIAGRGAGKTKTGAETIRSWVTGSTPLARGSCRRVALVAETAADGRDVIVEGDSGILACHPKDFRPTYEPSKRRLTWPNGALATIYSASDSDQLRGPQHDAAWVDELAKWARAQDVWDQVQFGLRLGQRPRAIVTTTPRPIPLLKKLIADQSTVVTRGKTEDNRANLAESFIKAIYGKYGGTRLGRQELDAEILEDLEGALWVRSFFDPTPESGYRGRANKGDIPDLVRVVVAVDPSGARNASDGGDSIGIIVAGLGTDGRGYVLADWSLRDGPAGWGRKAVSAYQFFSADRIVAEANFGGGMVESTIKTVDPSVPVTLVTASRGKILRAEPIASLYEQGRVTHVRGADPRDDGTGLAALEDQLCLMAYDGFAGEGSPDRVDALVWALTELMLEPQGRAGVLW